MLTQIKRRWAERASTARRDLSVLVGSVLGKRTPFLVTRPARTFADTAAAEALGSLTLRPLRVARIVRETRDAVSVFLEDPSGRGLEFVPGQFLTVEVEVDGRRLRRAYSLSTPPHSGESAITVKRIEGGRVSGHLNERLREGDVLHVLGPSGSFTVEPDPEADRHLVLLAGGSGITPIMSIARAVLATEPSSRVTLVYGNRGPADVIFRDALDALAAEHRPRFVVDHVLSDPPEGWTGATGMLDRATVEARLEALGTGGDAHTDYYVCGPDPMRAAVREVLRARRVPAARIHEEVFVRPELRGDERPLPDTDQTLHVRRDGLERTALVRPGQTLLEAGLSTGIALPFSCAMGGCAECKCKLREGEVVMEEPNCLTEEERSEGWVLTCVSRPLGTVKLEVPVP